MARQITPGKGLQILFQDSSFLGNANRLLAFLHKLCHQGQDLKQIISTNSNNSHGVSARYLFSCNLPSFLARQHSAAFKVVQICVAEKSFEKDAGY